MGSLERGRTLALGGLLLVGLGGCGWSHGYVLREYDRSLYADRAGSPLAGHTVSISASTDKFDLEQEPASQALLEPPGFQFVAASEAQQEQMERDSAAIRKEHEEDEFPTIGWVRNLFGSRIRNVRALTPPQRWIRELGTLAVRGRGAHIVDAKGGPEPDLGVKLRLKYLKVDMYMVFHVDLVVEAELRPRGRPPILKTYHVRPREQTAWMGATEEFSEVTRRAGQVLMAYLVEDMERLVGGRPVAALDGAPLD